MKTKILVLPVLVALIAQLNQTVMISIQILATKLVVAIKTMFLVVSVFQFFKNKKFMKSESILYILYM